MILAFHNGKFILSKVTTCVSIEEYRTKVLPEWKYVGAGCYETDSLKAALRFRDKADKDCEFVFRRTLAKYYLEPILPPLKFLDTHQREGIKWILSRSRSYLAHAPGAGKTCQAIVASLISPRPGPTLFVVPPTLSENWKREVSHFSKLMGITSTASIVPVSSEQHKMDWTSDFIICPDSMLSKFWVYKKLLKLRSKLIAVDEASRFKEPTSQRSKAFYGGKFGKNSYPGLFQECPHTVFLDGSPMPNRPLELWAPTYALNSKAIDFMDDVEFGYRYCGPTFNDEGLVEFRGSSNEAELRTKLQKDFMHVVNESELTHPERLRSILPMTYNPSSKAMKAWEEKNISKIKLSDIDESMSKGDIASYRKELGLTKVKWTAEYVRYRLHEKNESILLFAHHREVCENLSLELKDFNPFVLYGGVKASDREKAFKAFQAGKSSLIIANIQAGGRGHNLQKASRIVFCEYSWTDELNKQCEARASRKGNTRANIRCDYICVPSSLDEVILQALFRKQKTVKKIIG